MNGLPWWQDACPVQDDDIVMAHETINSKALILEVFLFHTVSQMLARKEPGLWRRKLPGCSVLDWVGED